MQKHRPLCMRIQESKSSFVNRTIAQAFLGNSPHMWTFIPLNGAPGGLFLLWDVDRIQVLGILKGNYSVTVLCRMVGLSVNWVCSNIYGLCNAGVKQYFWEEHNAIGDLCDLPWVYFGDFNAIRSANERTRIGSSSRERRDFNWFIGDFGLLEFDKVGPSFSFSSK